MNAGPEASVEKDAVRGPFPNRIDGTTPRPESREPNGAMAFARNSPGCPTSSRIPVVLCDLEGYTHAEAAKLLGCPVGTGG